MPDRSAAVSSFARASSPRRPPKTFVSSSSSTIGITAVSRSAYSQGHLQRYLSASGPCNALPQRFEHCIDGWLAYVSAFEEHGRSWCRLPPDSFDGGPCVRQLKGRASNGRHVLLHPKRNLPRQSRSLTSRWVAAMLRGHSRPHRSTPTGQPECEARPAMFRSWLDRLCVGSIRR